MLIIANNLTTRNRKVSIALRAALKGDSTAIQDASAFLSGLARDCIAAGANVMDINLQQRYDTPEAARLALGLVQESANCQLCLSCSNTETLEAALKICRRPPIVNYVSLDTSRLEKILPLVANYQAELILLIADPMPPATADEALRRTAVLIGAANEAGIPNSRLLVDPGVLHITSSAGQSHTRTLMELIPAIGEAFDPPVRTTCWVNNISAGASRRLRPVINSAFLAMLTGLGLSSAFLDMLDPQATRTVRLMSVFANNLIFSEGELERKG